MIVAPESAPAALHPAAPPRPEEIAFLDISEDERVYEITHIGWTADDQPVKVTLYVMPTHQWDLRYRYPIDPENAS